MEESRKINDEALNSTEIFFWMEVSWKKKWKKKEDEVYNPQL